MDSGIIEEYIRHLESAARQRHISAELSYVSISLQAT